MIPLSMNGMGIRKWNSSNPNRNAITKAVNRFFIFRPLCF